MTGAPRVGLYPGTFDPVTFGHLDIMRRAVKIVDHLVIGVAVNKQKGPLFSLEERVEFVEQAVQMAVQSSGVKVSVKPFDSLLVRFAEEVGASVVLRGLRAVSDFEYEFQMAGMNDHLNSDIETVFLMADPRHQTIASRLVKEIARLGGDVSHFTPRFVIDALQRKYASH